MVVLNNATTQDGYTPATTLVQPGSVRLRFVSISGASIYYQLASPDDARGGTWSSQEAFLDPQRNALDVRCSGVRVRSAIAGKPAQVTCQLLTAADLPPGA